VLTRPDGIDGTWEVVYDTVLTRPEGIDGTWEVVYDTVPDGIDVLMVHKS